MQIEELPVPPLLLGEGPIWNIAENRLYWVDGAGHMIFAADPDGKDVQRFEYPAAVGSVVMRKAGGLLVAGADGLALFDPATGDREVFAHPDEGAGAVALNDSGVDAQGRLLVGSIDHASYSGDAAEGGGRVGTASLFRVDTDLSVAKLATGFTNVNGPCWSPDGKTFYFSDTMVGRVHAADWDAAHGTFSNKRNFIDVSAEQVLPDGAAVDEDGCYWCACVGVGQLRRYSPSGELMHTINLPAPMVTSLAFGGPELDMLYATSLTYPFDGEAEGKLFRISGIGARGLEPNLFG